MADSGNAPDDAFPESGIQDHDSGGQASPPCPGVPNEGGSDCRNAADPPEIETILRGLDRFFIKECIKRLKPREKEGNPHE